MSVIFATLAAVLCAAPEPAPHGDAVAAGAYFTVAEGEIARGAEETAAIALREALRLDPSNGKARAALSKLCKPSDDDLDAFEQGARLLDAGDQRGAVALFEKARAAEPDPSAALLEGIAWYELGEDAAAKPLLLEAQNAPESAEHAKFFLGLIALREGDAATAAVRFASTASGGDRRLVAAATSMLKQSRRQGRLSLWLSLDPIYETNVQLLPDGAQRESASPDAAVSASAQLFGRPLGTTSPFFARLLTQYRQQATAYAMNLFTSSATVGWQGSLRDFNFVLEGGGDYFAFVAVDDKSYMADGRFVAAARWAPGAFSLGLTGRSRVERFLQPEYEAYSGLRNTGALDVAWRAADGSSLSLGLRLSGQFTSPRYADFGYREGGPGIDAFWVLGDDLRVGFTGGLLVRRYQAVPGFVEPKDVRRDQSVDAEVYAEYDLSDHWLLKASGGGQQRSSTDAAATYGTAFGSIGLVWVGGFL